MTKDLILLVPDKNTRFSILGLLHRDQILQIRPVSYDIYPHPKRDPGVYHDSANFLRSFINQYRYALIFLDHEGSGQETKLAGSISGEIRTNLERNGWQNRAEVIVFEPELEVWAWINSPHLATHLVSLKLNLVIFWQDILAITAKDHAKAQSRKGVAKKKTLRVLCVLASLRGAFVFWFRLVRVRLEDFHRIA